MKAFMVAVVVAASPAGAQEWIDFDLLMQQNAEKVVVAKDAAGKETRSLDLGDGVTVVCDDAGCMGSDQSENGAIGCTFSIYTEIAAFARACEVPLTQEQSAVLDGAYRDLGAFVARNAVPPLPDTYPQDLLTRRIATMKSELAAADANICANPFEGDYGMFLGAIVTNFDAAEFNRLIAVPRLPVMNPCL